MSFHRADDFVGSYRRQRAGSSASSCTIATDGSSDDVIGVETIDLTGDSTVRSIQLNSSTSPPDVIHVNGLSIRKGDVVEVAGISMEAVAFQDLKYPIEFIQVREIVRRVGSHPSKIRGMPITRTRNLLGKLSRKLNEVCLITQESVSDLSASETYSGLIEVDLASVIQLRKLIMTNAVYPEHSMEDALILDRQLGRPSAAENIRQLRLNVQETGTLVCRWRLQVRFTKTSDRRLKVDEECLDRVLEVEACPASYRASDAALRNRWRGESVKGGSFNHQDGSYNYSIDVDMPDRRATGHKHAPRRSYTIFDAYCGAGGVSRGAQRAGLKVAYAVDKSDKV